MEPPEKRRAKTIWKHFCMVVHSGNSLSIPLHVLHEPSTTKYSGIASCHKQFLISAGASMIIFRAELAVLFGLFLIIDLYFKKIDVVMLLKIVVPAGVGLVALTVIVDSIFWRRLLWPEAETSPFLWYFYSALPRGLGPSLVLVPVGVYLDRRLVPLAAPAVVYVMLYSILPHKELRFIIYVFPLLNMASAGACSYIYMRRTKAPIYELLFWGTMVIILGNVLLSIAFVSVAMTNYPGGVAMTRFHKLLKNEPFVHIHISNLAAQTGVTRFTEIHNHWKYSKNESLEPEQLQEYTHLLIEAKSKYSPNLKTFTYTHKVLDSIDTFSSVSINYKLLPPIRIKTRPALFILERKDFREYPQGHNVPSIKEVEMNDKDDTKEILTEDSFVNKESIVNLETNYVNSEDTFIEPLIGDEELSEDVEPIQTSIEEEADIETYVLPIDELVIKDDNKQIDQEPAEIEELFEKPKVKKAVDDLKLLRKEKKRKAIAKIKSETRKEVVASAKEKLRELMKRHKKIAEELSDSVVAEVKAEDEVDGRGDIPEMETVLDKTVPIETEPIPEPEKLEKEAEAENVSIAGETIGTNQNIDDIVEEVIARLIDRKIYDDKTKPEDIKAEDRQVIQQIVEEILAEKMNVTNLISDI
ncbi:hypothetical protein MSG28_007037 [Choristoneura fumiferana]|uniref:Uncharacterized protein n=1 Tax=Choristoneura fumiferana TaxID=7141 RepID=A0ACC0JMC7_CHOFU|nr:hypothetical protein MSG28_007037 [Choristoneura fumiferana]